MTLSSPAPKPAPRRARRLAHLPREGSPARAALAMAMAMAAAFGSGALLALVASGGIALERITHGDPRLALVANGLTTCAAVVVVVITGLCFGAVTTHLRSLRAGVAPLAVLAPQGAGAIAAIAVVHALLRASHAGNGLTEAPAQLVNDAVAAFALLALVWGCARRTVAASSVALALAALAVYGATASRWHLDAFTTTFRSVTVQQFVSAECVGVGVALLIFRLFARPSPDA